MRKWTWATHFAVLGLLTACATPVTKRVGVESAEQAQEERTQQRLAIKTHFEYEARLRRVGYSVLKGAAGECGAVVRPALGFTALRVDDIPEAQRAVIAEAVGVTNERRVNVVLRNSAAEAAGLKVGDIVVSAAPPSTLTVTANETR